MVKSLTPRLSQTRWSSGTDTVRRLDFDTDAANLDDLVAIYAQDLLSARPAAGTEGRLFIVAGDSAANNGKIFYDNGSSWSAPRYVTDATAESTAAGNVALVAKGAASQSVDVFRVVSSTDVTVFRVTAGGIFSNQSTLGTTAGVYFGRSSAHEAAAAFISVGTDKPVLSLKAALSQTENLIKGLDSNGATIFSVTATGGGTFNGAVSAASLTTSGAISSASLTTTTSTTVKGLLATPVNTNSPAAIFRAFSSPLNNIVDYADSSGTRLARITPEGTFATNSRVVIGNNNGDSISTSYGATTAALWVQNSYPSAPVARFIGNATQSGKLLELADSTGTNKLTVDVNGNVVASSNISSTTLSINSGTPTSWFSGYVPPVEIITGTTSGTYNESVVVRHSQNSAATDSRTLNFLFKFADEASSGNSAKYAGINGFTSEVSAANPNLGFIAGGVLAGYFNASKDLILNNNLYVSTTGAIRTQGNNRAHWFLSTDETNTIGLQPSTTYFRAPSFAWYSGGAHSNTQFDAGTGGTFFAKIENASGDGVRFTTGKITVTATTAFDALNPALSIGAANNTTGHMQFSNLSINVLDSSQNPLTLNLQQSGGTLNLGGSNTDVKLPSRLLYIGSNRIYFGGATFDPGSPAQNDWWFDHSNESIKIRRSDGSWFNVAGTG